MAQKSHGSRHGTRKKFSKDRDSTLTVNDRIKNFENGDQVLISFHPSVQEGRVHSRYHGKHATVKGKKGEAYELSVEDGNGEKELRLRSVHLKEVDN